MNQLLNLAITAVLLISTASIATSQDFIQFTGEDIFGMDYNDFDIANSVSEHRQVQICEDLCKNDGKCMAYTWVHSGIQPSRHSTLNPTAHCWLKSDARLFPPLNPALRTMDGNTSSGIKNLGSSSCWARHIFNLKFCSVFTGLTTCPSPARNALINTGSPEEPFNHSCVIRRSNDPGGLPNCTDAFGGDAHEEGVLGSRVNQACLDSN